jgi:hypothetical protein
LTGIGSSDPRTVPEVMVPEVDQPGTLHQLVASGEATAPAERGMPDLIPDLVPEIDSLAEALVADRDRERTL